VPNGAGCELVGADEFFEIYIDTPLAECIRRDAKGLYAKAQAGMIKNFTGFGSPYEPPQAPELVLATMTGVRRNSPNASSPTSRAN